MERVVIDDEWVQISMDVSESVRLMIFDLVEAYKESEARKVGEEIVSDMMMAIDERMRDTVVDIDAEIKVNFVMRSESWLSTCQHNLLLLSLFRETLLV